MAKKRIDPSLIQQSEDFTMDQSREFARKGVAAFEMLSDLSEYLYQIGVVLVTATLAVKITGRENDKILVTANPGMEEGQIEEALRVIGEEAGNAARQAKTLTKLAESFDGAGGIDCDTCSSRDKCDKLCGDTIN